jgi:hypothetical protein
MVTFSVAILGACVDWVVTRGGSGSARSYGRSWLWRLPTFLGRRGCACAVKTAEGVISYLGWRRDRHQADASTESQRARESWRIDPSNGCCARGTTVQVTRALLANGRDPAAQEQQSRTHTSGHPQVRDDRAQDQGLASQSGRRLPRSSASRRFDSHGCGERLEFLDDLRGELARRSSDRTSVKPTPVTSRLRLRTPATPAPNLRKIRPLLASRGRERVGATLPRRALDRTNPRCHARACARRPFTGCQAMLPVLIEDYRRVFGRIPYLVVAKHSDVCVDESH